MKNFFILPIIFFLACSPSVTRETPEHAHEEPAIDHYTCSMHPQIHREGPGTCPICGMPLVPVYKEDSRSKKENSGIFISEEKQRLVDIQTILVRQDRVIKKISATGIVAFDRELTLAQKEYLEILKTNPSLKKSAQVRLRLLGMSSEEISFLEKNRKISSDLFYPSTEGNVWVYASFFQEELSLIVPGTLAKISIPGSLDFVGEVRSIDPVIDSETRTGRARIFVKGAGSSLRPQTFVHVALEIHKGLGLLIPKEAVLRTGTQNIVYTVDSTNHFSPQEIQIGEETEKYFWVVSGLKEGDRIVSSAVFLVDAETRLKETPGRPVH